MATTTATQIQQLYVGLLGRAADKSGLDWWVDQVTTGGRTLEDVRASFVTSTEYTTTYGAAATRAELVTSIYQNLFERTPSADEVKYWAETDTRPADQLVAAFIEFGSANDQKVITNKVFVAQTYTDTVGTGFSKDGAAAVIADVDGTSASVAAAIKSLNDGALDGQVPGVGLINALATAQAEFATFETSNKAAVDALAVTLEVNVADDASFEAALQQVSDAADAARDKVATAPNSDADTGVLIARASTAATKLTDARAVLTAPEKALAAKYDAAAAAEVVALKGVATPTEKGAAIGGLTADATADTGLAALGTLASPAVLATQADVDNGDATAVGDVLTPAVNAAPATASDVYARYVNGDTAQRKVIDSALKDSDFYASFKAVAAKDAAAVDATKAVAAAAAVLDDTANGDLYIKAVTVKNAADKLVADAKAADVNKAAVDAIVKAYAAADDKVGSAVEALGEYNQTHTTTQTVALASGAADSAVKEAFYFDTKVSAADDFTIGTAGAAGTHFGAGDAIVLGTGYTFNSGALSTGDNNKLEFFFVNTDAGVQVVVESANFGSGAATPSATTGIGAVANDNLAVITLTGVTADHLSVNNGVVSYV